jgi:hypothetical protein
MEFCESKELVRVWNPTEPKPSPGNLEVEWQPENKYQVAAWEPHIDLLNPILSSQPYFLFLN